MFISGHAAFSNCRCCLYSVLFFVVVVFVVVFFFTVIGGYNVYLRLSINGKCDNKGSVWKKLREEVLL